MIASKTVAFTIAFSHVLRSILFWQPADHSADLSHELRSFRADIVHAREILVASNTSLSSCTSHTGYLGIALKVSMVIDIL